MRLLDCGRGQTLTWLDAAISYIGVDARFQRLVRGTPAVTNAHLAMACGLHCIAVTEASSTFG